MSEIKPLNDGFILEVVDHTKPAETDAESATSDDTYLIDLAIIAALIFIMRYMLGPTHYRRK